MVLWGLLRRQVRLSSLKICSIACLVAPGNDARERASGVPFPGRLPRSAERSQEHILMATGVRRVFLGMQAYAAGLYLEEEFARSLSKDCRPPLIRGASYTIRIVPVRNTSLGHIRDALGRKLKEVLMTEVSAEGREAAQGEIGRFMAAFPNVRLGMGEELLITRQGPSIHVKRPQQPGTMVEDAAWVGECLLRLYSEASVTSIPDLPRDLCESAGVILREKPTGHWSTYFPFSAAVLMLRCVEFFSGIGGLHYALQDCGVPYEMLAAYDINTVANTVYAHNFGLRPTSVNLEHLGAGHFERLKATCWLLSPPCQPYTRGGKLLDDEDLRAVGLLHLIKVLEELETPPTYVFLENVLNFEKSRSRDRLVEVLARRGYQVAEFLITPNDPWVALPNDRLRYYLAARRVQDDARPYSMPKAGDIIQSLSIVLGPPSQGHMAPLREYLRPNEGSDPRYRVPDKYITDYKNYRHDIANPNGTRSTTFTKAYGSNYIIGTGSFLQTERLELPFEPDDQATLLTLGLRFFTPMEIALLHALPVADDIRTPSDLPHKFSFPSQVTIPQQYRLLGNSLNVRVVSRILGHLFAAELGRDPVPYGQEAREALLP